MIDNFEDVTYELTEEEMKLLPIIKKGFEFHIGKAKLIKGATIVEKINDKAKEYDLSSQFSEVRLRKIVNYIRINSILPLIATSKGYYVSNDKQEILTQCKSLEQRANAILAAREGLLTFAL